MVVIYAANYQHLSPNGSSIQELGIDYLNIDRRFALFSGNRGQSSGHVSPRDWSRFSIIRLIDNETYAPDAVCEIVFTRPPGLISSNVAAEWISVEIMGAGEDEVERRKDSKNFCRDPSG